MTPIRRHALFVVAVLAIAVSASARVISYSPYTDRAAYPAYQARSNRFFVLVEATPSSISAPTPSASYGQLVVYDSTNELPPRVVFPPQQGTSTVFTLAAVRESDGVPSILVQAADSATAFGFYLSTDGGSNWKKLDLPTQPVPQILATGIDTGGPFTVSRYSPVRTGTTATPFVVAGGSRLYAVNADASIRVLYESTPGSVPLAVAGSDAGGTKFLVRTTTTYVVVGLDGTNSVIGQVAGAPLVDGFIAADGSVYVDERFANPSIGTLTLLRNGGREKLFDVNWTWSNQDGTATPNLFLVPTSDYSGAWIVQRYSGPTVLYRHTPAGGLVKQWEDITAPEVEALHSGLSGTKVLIQVHRPRPAVDQRMFRDPALAVWHVGDPAPRGYDELYMNEQWNKGFIHLDVEKIEGGEPFVFDSGSSPWGNGGGGGGIIVSPPPAAGGGDVTQEWGVVRASLKQQLVLPSIGRVKGNFGSDWATDVIVQNPLDTAQTVPVSFIPDCKTDCATIAIAYSLVLQPHETHLYKDALKSVFNLDSGAGAMVFNPPDGINVTSRTYSKAANGTFGFGMNGIDAFAAASSPRFPVSFAGAFPGTDFRTNLTLTDPSGHNSEVTLTAANRDGLVGPYDVTAKVGGLGHSQINGVTGMVGMSASEAGALVVQPKSGSVIASVYAIDNRTNDSTYFPPDLPSTTMVRTIPVIGHVDGANNSRFRTDLYLYNPSDQPRTVMLQAKLWTVPEQPATLQLTLLAHEARVIKDALFTVFGKTGLARLRYSNSITDSSGVRVTSRTYNIDPNGGTYGFLTPPLNNFQIGGGGDTLEILGAVADPQFRVNVGLVELNGWPTGQNVTARVDIVDSTGKQIDSFNVNVASAGGIQLNDVFNARGLTVTGPVLIRVSPATGTIGAYATMTDNGTNDSVYLAANLAAK